MGKTSSAKEVREKPKGQLSNLTHKKIAALFQNVRTVSKPNVLNPDGD